MVFLMSWAGYPRDVKWRCSVSVYSAYISGSVVERSMRVSSPLIIPLCVVLGCDEL